MFEPYHKNTDNSVIKTMLKQKKKNTLAKEKLSSPMNSKAALESVSFSLQLRASSWLCVVWVPLNCFIIKKH